ncbi:MAG: hypothetical protein H6581_30050 [Bacteroidia bacterium]|nr:hypothetical protein [Bacteroidia bacterium]
MGSKAKHAILEGEALERAIEANKEQYFAHFDPDYAGVLARHVIDLIDEIWFRSRFIGFEQPLARNQPERPLIFAGNHSGMAFPWDGIIFAAGMYTRSGGDLSRMPRPLAAPVLSQSNLMNPFLIAGLWKKVGCLDATSLNFETMMQFRESDVMIYPEGVEGIGKGFNHRYHLQPFHISMIRMAVRYQTDIVPVFTINGEYINPFTWSVPFVNRLTSAIGIPFLPIGLLTLFLPFCPWMFYFSWPANLTYLRGERISPWRMTDKRFEEMTREDFENLRDKVQVEMQGQISRAVLKYGKNPFRTGHLIRQSLKNILKFPFYTPLGWPLLFAEFDRQYRRQRKTGKPIKIYTGLGASILLLLRNPFAFFYYLPVLGWIPILIRGFRR